MVPVDFLAPRATAIVTERTVVLHGLSGLDAATPTESTDDGVIEQLIGRILTELNDGSSEDPQRRSWCAWGVSSPHIAPPGRPPGSTAAPPGRRP
jgi:hypothetical protein